MKNRFPRCTMCNSKTKVIIARNEDMSEYKRTKRTRWVNKWKKIRARKPSGGKLPPLTITQSIRWPTRRIKKPSCYRVVLKCTNTKHCQQTQEWLENSKSKAFKHIYSTARAQRAK